MEIVEKLLRTFEVTDNVYVFNNYYEQINLIDLINVYHSGKGEYHEIEKSYESIVKGLIIVRQEFIGYDYTYCQILDLGKI